jgi:hypothetical protein
LEAFVDRPEFAAGAAEISQAGRQAQEPVLGSGRCLGECGYGNMDLFFDVWWKWDEVREGSIGFGGLEGDPGLKSKKMRSYLGFIIHEKFFCLISA